METLIIGVIASDSEEYNFMKTNWQTNADKCKKNVRVYFIYGDENLNRCYNITDNTLNTKNFYVKCQENFENLLYKTLVFFNWVVSNATNYMLVRSNLSTLFKLDVLFDLCKDFYKHKYFFGGTFTEGYFETNSIFSGTNLTFSPSTVNLICDNRDELLKATGNDDQVISNFIFKNYYSTHVFYNIKRLDFTDIILFQFMDISEIDDIFCYRFKSSNRKEDGCLMKSILDNNFNKDYTMTYLIFNYSKYLKVYHDTSLVKENKITLCNEVVDTSISGVVKILKIPVQNKMGLTLLQENSLGYFKITPQTSQNKIEIIS